MYDNFYEVWKSKQKSGGVLAHFHHLQTKLGYFTVQSLCSYFSLNPMNPERNSESDNFVDITISCSYCFLVAFSQSWQSPQAFRDGVNCLDPFQSVFRPEYGTETALVTRWMICTGTWTEGM